MFQMEYSVYMNRTKQWKTYLSLLIAVVWFLKEAIAIEKEITADVELLI